MRVPQVSERIKEAPAQALRGVFAGIGQLLLVTDKIRNKGSHQDVARARAPRAPETVTDTTVTSPADRGAGTATAPAARASAGAAPASAGPAAAAAAAKPASAESGPAEAGAAKPAAARRTATKPASGKPVTPKPATKPVTAKPPTARRTTPKAAAAESGAAVADTPPKPPRRQSARDFDKTGNVRLISDGTASSAAASTAAAETGAGAAPTEAAETGAAPTAAAPLPNYDELSLASLRARLRNLDVTQVKQLAEYERTHAARADVLTMFERRVAKLEAEA
jgi:hypothetical protein